MPEILDDTGDRTLVARSGSVSSCATCDAPVQPAWRFCKSCGAPAGPGAHAPVRARHALARMAEDGEVEAPRALREGRTIIGRTDADLAFPHDGTLSSRHAALVVAGPSCDVVDLGSTNGTFASVRGDEPLDAGDVILVGSRRLLYRRAAKGHEIVEILDGGAEGRRVRLAGSRVVLGKDRSADLSFPGDDHVSRRHAEIVRTASGYVVRDLGSTNRTFLLVTTRRQLRDGDRIATGGQIFEYRRLA